MNTPLDHARNVEALSSGTWERRSGVQNLAMMLGASAC
jgi:hypothetical protein